MSHTESAPGAGELGLSTEETADAPVLHVRGEVDVYTSPSLRAELYRLIDAGHTRVVLDLHEMDFIDSSGLGVLVGALKRLREQAGDLELRRVQPGTRKILEITGLTQVLTIVE